MSLSYSFTADHHGFYRDGHLFYPLIQEAKLALMDWSNTACVSLKAHLKDDLNWIKEKELAQAAIDQGKCIFWELDLGLTDYTFNPKDTASFFALSLAIEEFSKQIWPSFQKHSFGVGIYRGTLNASMHFPYSEWEASFLEDNTKVREYPLYCMDLLADYLHRLVCFLPTEILVFVFFDVTQESSPSKAAQWLSKTRFEHMHLAIQGAKAPFSGLCWEKGEYGQGWFGSKEKVPFFLENASLGICLPEDHLINADLIAKMDNLIKELTAKHISFRIIPEDKLTEEWDGLENLVVFANGVSLQGKRKLLGFTAAGGKIEWKN